MRRLLSLPLLVVAGPAFAAGDPTAGEALTQRWCSGCHGSTDAAPTLSEAVNRPERREGTLKAWLTDPHPPMPNLSLSRAQIDDVVAYLASLQKPR
jgi:mono/diheme cytochrome c family protein